MRWLPIALALLGCGSTTKKKESTCWDDCGTGPGNTQLTNEAETHRQLCERAKSLADAACPPFDQMDPRLLAGNCGVVTSFQMAGMDHCLAEKDCESLSACFSKTRAADAPTPYRGPTRECQLPADHDDLAFPAGFSHAEMADSYGAAAKTYADTPSSKEHPIEVCGFPAAGAWLARMTCKDGSHPFPSRNDAERARGGNAGPGGRCGRIIDQYAVECAEATYTVFVDSYRCER